MTARNQHDDHDDFGGLHRDLLATGAAMDRRGVLRLAARFGMGAGALQLLGCGGSSSPTSPSRHGHRQRDRHRHVHCTRIPQETAGPVSRRRLERARTSSA